MPGAGRAEVYFIVAMMLLILVVCGVAVYAFFKTYKKEMRERAARQESHERAKAGGGDLAIEGDRNAVENDLTTP